MTRPAIFITGAAAGIGQAIAEHFANAGWRVGAYDVNQAGVEALQERHGADTIQAGVLDVTDRAAWDTALNAFCSGNPDGRLQVLVNNAGILDSGPFHEITMASHDRIIDINVKGVMNGCHAAFEHLRGTPGACIVNIASASAIYGQPALASYAASKFAVRGLTEGLNLEWEPHGIRVVDIWPLFVRTAMVDGMRADSIERMGVKLLPQDVARTVQRAVDAGSRSSKVHWTVGWEAAAFARLVRTLPESLTRGVAKRLVT